MTYSNSVNKLLELGKPKGDSEWLDYKALGITESDVPQLIEMFSDEKLNWADEESNEVWAPLHAWRAASQLRAKEAILPLIDLFESLQDDEWALGDLPQVMAMIGEDCIKPLAGCLLNGEDPEQSRMSAAECIKEIGKTIPEKKEECISILSNALSRADEAEGELNGMIVWFLLDLEAVSALNVIREVYKRDAVDISICGDIEDVEIKLGVRRFRDTPQPRYNVFPFDIDSGAKKKIGRNDPCPCGSGKKYKKCCLGK